MLCSPLDADGESRRQRDAYRADPADEQRAAYQVSD
jgi:hypothetical protein